MRRPQAPTWQTVLDPQFNSDYWETLEAFVDSERVTFPGHIYPPETQVFAAIEALPRSEVKVVILGQDPYHGSGQAHGFAFSVPPGIPKPPSLRNILGELESDLGLSVSNSGSLLPWVQQGVLLLNAVLTVRDGAANSHRRRGWETLTDALISSLGQQTSQLVFLLWGNAAISKTRLIDRNRHAVIASPHPSPLSAHRGFFGSRPFSRVNQRLEEFGKGPIDWRL